MSFLARLTGIQNDTFGLDIGYQTIKVIQLKRSGSLFILKAGGASPCPTEPFAKNRVKDKKALATAINKARADFHITATGAVSALPESMVFTKIIQMPIMSEKELKNAVPLEAASFIPYEPEQTYIDYQISGSSSNTYEILVIAAPKTLIDDILETMKIANLELLCLETKPLANTRVLIRQGVRETVMILDVGARATSLTICEDGFIKFTATISFGGHIYKDIIERFANGLAEYSAEKEKQIIEEILNSLATNALEGVKYYQGHKAKRTVDRILVVGGGAKMPGLVEFLAEKSKIKTELGNPWQFIKNPPQKTETLRATTAIGLAMRDI